MKNLKYLVLIILLVSLSNVTYSIDCSLVKCAQPICKPYYHIVVPEGSCCGICEKCTVVCPLIIKCGANQIPSGCCPCFATSPSPLTSSFPSPPIKLQCPARNVCPAIIRYCGIGEKPSDSCCGCVEPQNQ